MPKKKCDYLSHTQIQIGRCPMLYDAMYNKGLYKDRESLPLRIGKFKHEFVQKYVDFCIKSEQESDLDEMKKIFHEIWEKYYIPEENYQLIFDECLGFAEKNVSFNNVLDTEKRIKVEFAPGKFILGIIDCRRIYGFRGIALKDNDKILHLIDYKNISNILKPEEILTTQMRIYTLLSYYDLPKFPYYRRLIYFLKRNFIRGYENEDNPTSLADIEIEVQATKEMLLRQWEKLKEAKEYPAITGSHCYQYEGCRILLEGKCPAIKKKDYMSIDDTIRKVFQMKTQIKDLKKRAKEYIIENGNVTVDDQEIGFIEDTKETYPFEPGYNIAKETGYDLDKENFPKSIMERVIKEAGSKLNGTQLLKEIEKLKITTEGTKFNLK